MTNKKAIQIFGLCISLSVVSCNNKSKPAKELPTETAEVKEEFKPHFNQEVSYEDGKFSLITYYKAISYDISKNSLNKNNFAGYALPTYPYENTIKGDFEFIKNNKAKELQKAKEFIRDKEQKEKQIEDAVKILNDLK